MNDELAVEEIVTKFLLNTCRLCPKLSRPAVEAAMFCAGISTNTRLDINLLPVTEGNMLSLIACQITACLVTDLPASHHSCSIRGLQSQNKIHIYTRIYFRVVRPNKKTRIRYTSPICPEAVSRWICAKFGLGGPLADRSNCTKFCYN